VGLLSQLRVALIDRAPENLRDASRFTSNNGIDKMRGHMRLQMQAVVFHWRQGAVRLQPLVDFRSFNRGVLGERGGVDLSALREVLMPSMGWALANLPELLLESGGRALVILRNRPSHFGLAFGLRLSARSILAFLILVILHLSPKLSHPPVNGFRIDLGTVLQAASAQNLHGYCGIQL
jgi:hypothetical protein